MSARPAEVQDQSERATPSLATVIQLPLPEATTSTPPAAARAGPSAAVAVAHATPSSLLENLHRMGHRALAEVNYQLRRIGTATFAGTVAIVAAVAVFIAGNLPQVSAIEALKGDLQRLNVPDKNRLRPVPAAATLPPRGDAPKVVAKILEEAGASGVELPRGQYEYIPARDGVAARYRMTFPVHATYPKIREFMDRTMVALPAVAIEGLRIERKTVGDDSVDAELKLSAYVRSDP